jgi:asparagine synthase (glutamine-hydrolysing)
MCGFAGVIAWDEKYRITRETLAKMSAAIAHRGPDGEGFHLTRENEPITPDSPQAGLAFRRLAILDPDPRSNQPFHIGPLTLVFNGEIYNFRALRSEISKLRPDYQWRTTGDTEVLLMSYEIWGEKCVEKLNGMFAFAVWDEQKKELFLARDRMGQKPLFYALIDSQGKRWIDEVHTIGSKEIKIFPSARLCFLAFASEISALRCINWLDATIDIPALGDYLRYGYVGCFWQTKTIYSVVQKVSPCNYVTVNLKGAKFQTYFDPNAVTANRKVDEEAVNYTRRLVTESVARQLVSDVPIGCFLSGGIDSSVIACAMSEAMQCDQKILTFSIGFDDPRYDETQYASAVAKHLGTEHHQFNVRPNAAEDLIKLAAVFGEPFGDSSALPTHYLSQETRRHVKVALSGDGGDELFGGYDRYRAMRITENLSRLPRFAARLIATIPWHLLPGIENKSTSVRFKRLMAVQKYHPAGRYSQIMSLFDEALVRDLLTPEIYRQTQSGIEILSMRYQMVRSGRDVVESALATDRLTYLPDDLLTKVDCCSMLHALEVRSPFMDHELVQFAAGLTTDQLLKGGPKRMLREAFAADLPDFVFKRKKMGFAVPIGEWFRGELREMLRDNLFACDSFARSHFNMNVVQRLIDEHEQQRVDHSQRLYALLMLELWWRWHRSS